MTQPRSEAAPITPTPPGPLPASERAADSQGGKRVASIATELSTLERARRALVAQRPDQVQRELDSYRRMPRSGVLDAEAELLAVEALLQRGDIAGARASAARALASSPNGPHAARLRAILATNR